MRTKVQLPSPLACENRARTTFEVSDQGLLHGEGAEAVTTGQASGQHVTFRNELKGILLGGMVLSFQVNP